jgi:DNA-directed RNA polymerase
MDLIKEQRYLEEQMRGLGVSRFHRSNDKANERGDLSSTLPLVQMTKGYMLPYTKAISEFVRDAMSGKVGRKNTTAKAISELEPEVVAFLFLKAIFNKVPTLYQGKPCTFVGLAIYGAGLIHDELRIRYFHKNWRNLARKMWSDFEVRELPRNKRKELVQRKFNDFQIDWNAWDKQTMLHVGSKLIELFISMSGKDIDVVTIRNGKRTTDVIQPSPSLLEAVFTRLRGHEALVTTYLPCVIPPVPWAHGTLSRGGYHTEHVTPYPLVKGSKSSYRKALDGETIAPVIRSVNALQETPWRVNKRVLTALEHVYRLDRAMAGLPNSSLLERPPVPPGLDPDDRTSEASQEYRKACYIVHDKNRREIAKRIQVERCIQLGMMFSQYERIYFPHDLDSRGRAYPKPAVLNPQGPDYAKGLLEFAVGKQLGTQDAVCWLAIHGANSWGYDKASLQERVDWVKEHEELILSCAKDPISDLRWTEADNPFQFLSFCYEWDGYDKDGLEWVSHAHIDVDATCSGLQHFSAMLRDEEGGRYVNMVPNLPRQDIYGRVAEKATAAITADLGGEFDALAKAWLSFGLDRSITKRSVMVVPYAGTFHSCMTYTADSVNEKLEKGVVHPWPDGKMTDFTVYGAKKIWAAIETTVVAAVGAMNWLGSVASMVARVPGATKVVWDTPLNFPVHQAKWNLKTRRVETFFDGHVIHPHLVEETDKLDPRQMASSVAPSFVHSLDASHMMATINYALDNDITHFAAVHDSFGTHACKLPKFNWCIRKAFIDIYENRDVLADFLVIAKMMIPKDQHEDIPPLPEMGMLDITAVMDSQFFFS